MPKRAAVATLAVAVALAGCSKSAAPTTTTQAPVTTQPATTTTSAAVTTSGLPTTKELAAKFLALIAPVNAEERKLMAQYPNGPTSMTQLTPLVAPFTTFDNALLRIGLTGQAATDARSLVTAISAQIEDIQNDDSSTLTADVAAFSSSDNALRADLGLPAAPGS